MGLDTMSGYDETDFGRDNLCMSMHCKDCYCNKSGHCRWTNVHFKKWIEETSIHGISLSHVLVGNESLPSNVYCGS